MPAGPQGRSPCGCGHSFCKWESVRSRMRPELRCCQVDDGSRNVFAKDGDGRELSPMDTLETLHSTCSYSVQAAWHLGGGQVPADLDAPFVLRG